MDALLDELGEVLQSKATRLFSLTVQTSSNPTEAIRQQLKPRRPQRRRDPVSPGTWNTITTSGSPQQQSAPTWPGPG